MTEPAEPGSDPRSLSNPMDHRLGIEVLEASPERVVRPVCTARLTCLLRSV